MKAEIIGIGTELLMGELTDTNSSWIAGRLPALGIELQWVSIIGDDLPRLTEAFKTGMDRSDIIFTTGGLGPTQDDLTREAIAAAFGETPMIQQEVVDNLERYFAAAVKAASWEPFVASSNSAVNQSQLPSSTSTPRRYLSAS